MSFAPGIPTGQPLHPFEYMKPKDEETTAKIQALREVFHALDERLMLDCPVSREMHLARTKLEECAMWAIKSIVFHQGEVQ